MVPPALRRAGTAIARPEIPRSAPSAGQPTRKARELRTRGREGRSRRGNERDRQDRADRGDRHGDRREDEAEDDEFVTPGARGCGWVGGVEAVGDQLAPAQRHDKQRGHEYATRPGDVGGRNRHDGACQEGS